MKTKNGATVAHESKTNCLKSDFLLANELWDIPSKCAYHKDQKIAIVTYPPLSGATASDAIRDEDPGSVVIGTKVRAYISFRS